MGTIIPTCEGYVPGGSTERIKTPPIISQKNQIRPDFETNGPGGIENSSEHVPQTTQPKVDAANRPTSVKGVDSTKYTYEPDTRMMKSAKERGLRTKREER